MNEEISVSLLNLRENAECGVARLYKLAGWLPDEESDYSKIKTALENSHCAYGAFDGEKMVGFFRAISDRIGDAYLLELFVEPAYRRRGIGERLCRAVTLHLAGDGITWQTCISTPEGAGVYAKLGKPMAGHIPFKF